MRDWLRSGIRMHMPQTPLAGIKVIELARILAGPWIGQTLADLGADGIKVERPQGDDRGGGAPPFVHDTDGHPVDAAYFHCCNRGKRSLTVDLRSAEGAALVRELATEADVFIENFKVGGLAKYGLDYATLHALNPRLVYCSVTGFGQDGPYAQRAGYGAMIQAMGGLMSITGATDGPPQKVGVAIGDLCAGLYGVIAIQAALAMRERTGCGQQVDIALLDTMVAMLANQNLNYLVSGEVPARLGNAHPNIVPYQVFAVRDGHVMLAVGNDSQFAALCAELELAGLAQDARFASNAARVVHRDALVDLLASALVRREREALLDALEQRGVPAGPINTIDQVFDNPQVRHRGMQLDLESARHAGGHLPGVRTPIRFSDATLALSRPSPRLGEHDGEIREELAMRRRKDGD